MQRLLALAQKEFIQIRRDKRTLAMMIMLPLLWLVMFGYAFSFDVQNLKVAVVDQSGTPTGATVAHALRHYERFSQVPLADPTEKGIRDAIYRGRIHMGVVIPRAFGSSERQAQSRMRVFIDGSDLFAAQTAARMIPKSLESVQEQVRTESAAAFQASLRRQIEQAAARRRDEIMTRVPPMFQAQVSQMLGSDVLALDLRVSPPNPPAMIPHLEIMYNPELKSANVMIPVLLGLVVMFMTTMMTAMGVVREREYGTIEQLIVTPIRPFELILGKLLPYFLVAALDFALVFVAGTGLFGLHFAGNLAVFLGLSLLLVFTNLGLGLLLSTLAQNQQQAMQLAIFAILPQILLSGLIFPLASLPPVIRFIARLFPFTYYVPIARGMFIKGQTISLLATPALVLAAYAVGVLVLASLRFRKRLA